MSATLLTGDSLTVLRVLPGASVRCCVTSPPYWGLRDYGMPDQLGLEATPEQYVEKMVEVFREVRRVLADDGTLWLNLGDNYAASLGQRKITDAAGPKQQTKRGSTGSPSRHVENLKPKDLVGIPWRVAFALQADGWYLRSDIIWAKPNPMPESVTDRPTKSHEYLFLLSKSPRYYYDADAVAERSVTGLEAKQSGYAPPGQAPHSTSRPDNKQDGVGKRTYSGFNERYALVEPSTTRNARTVWTIPTQPYAAAHFATFPEELARRCIMAGSAPGDTVLDPFGGSGTVGQVATGNARNALLIELNPAYIELARQRIGPMLCTEVI